MREQVLYPKKIESENVIFVCFNISKGKAIPLQAQRVPGG
jgi:hypothetical protein